MNALTPVGFAAALCATAAVLTLTRPIRGRWISWPAAALGAVVCVVTAVIGGAVGLPVGFVVGLGLWALPVAAVVATASAALGFTGGRSWLLVAGWGLFAFPVTALVPAVASYRCVDDSCRVDDFGGALPLAFSAVAFVLVARSARASVPTDPWAAHPIPVRPGMQILAVVGLWLAFTIWLTHLEGVVDTYIPRIIVGAVIGPLAAAIGWTVVDLVRGQRRPVIRSLSFGLVVGMPATLAGVVTVGSPWAQIAAVAAGAVGAVVFSIRPGEWLAVRRAAASAGAATFIGFLAAPIAGDMTGVLFTGSAGGLIPPLIAVLGVCMWAGLVGWISWTVARVWSP